MQNLCGTIGANTGGIPCDAQRGIPKKFFAGGKVFIKSEYATPDTFQAALRAAALLPTGDPDKMFPFPEISGTTDNTDALKTAALGYGLKQITTEGRPAYQFQVVCGQALFQEMRKFNRAIVPILMADDGNNGWGTYNDDTTFNGEYAQIFVSGNGFGDGTKTLNATIDIMYQSASDFNDSSKYVPLNFNPNSIKGLLNVELSEYAVHAANVYHIQGLVATAKLGTFLNMEKDFGTEMEDEALWILKKADGTSLAITSVAAVANLGWTFTMDSTAYGALASGAKLFLSWAGPADLSAADVTGVETPSPLVITKP